MERFGVVLLFILSVTAKVDGNWGPWRNWGACSVTCAGGDQSRTRVCQDNRFCSGTEINSQNCNNIPCPIHGGWEAWESWTSCSATCGGGFSSRERSCDSPSPAFGGRFCEGGNPANIDNESVEWEWRACSTVDCQGRPLAPAPLPTLSPTVTTASPGRQPVASLVPVPTPVPSVPTPSPSPQVPSGSFAIPSAPTTSPSPQVSSDSFIISFAPTPSLPPQVPSGSFAIPAAPAPTTFPNSPASSGDTVERPPEQQAPGSPSTLFPVTGLFPTEGETSSRGSSSPSGSVINLPSSGGSPSEIGGFSTGTGRSPAQSGGAPAGSFAETQSNQPSSAVHGGWGVWKPWTSCSVSCGGGTSSRQRNCDNPIPRFGGRFCESEVPQNIDRNNVEWEWKICNRFRCPGVPANVPFKRITRPKLPLSVATGSPSWRHQSVPSTPTAGPKNDIPKHSPVPSPTRAPQQDLPSTPSQHRPTFRQPNQAPVHTAVSQSPSPASRFGNEQQVSRRPAPSPIYRQTPRSPMWYPYNPFTGTRMRGNWWVRRTPFDRYSNYPTYSSSSSGSLEGRDMGAWMY